MRNAVALTLKLLKENIEKRHLPWVVSRPTLLDYLICMAMFWNGVLIIGISIIKVRQKMGMLGRLEETLVGCSAAVPGTTSLGTVVLRLAATTRPAAAPVSSVFESSVLLSGLYNLLFFCLDVTALRFDFLAEATRAQSSLLT